VDVPPNAQALITNINFTVTKSGLEGQLLSITINFEQPELESRKTQLLEEEERLQIQLAGYEKQLLEELANSVGNILENKTLIDSLNQTKT
jgi:dynein heavy chain 2